MASNSFATNAASLILNGHPFSDYLDGDIMQLTPVNPLTARQRGQNSVNIIKRSDSNVYDLVVRLLRNSADDVYMNIQANQPQPVVFNGSLQINFLNSSGDEGVEAWDLTGGSFTTQPTEVLNNIDGNSLMEYTIQFNQGIRTI
jgi:hypothetical protein